MYPVPFVGAGDLVSIASRAAALGYGSVWANDHYTTQAYVRQQFADPPNYYEPLITLATAAARVPRVGLGTGVLVAPMRDPVVLAKQVATLDVLSGGRVRLGVGIGAYREEYRAAHPGASIHRGEVLTETLVVLRMLFETRRATFCGRWLAIEDIELYPKPLQVPLPIYVAGNSKEAIQRAAIHGQAWMPGAFSTEWGTRSVASLREAAARAGREPNAVKVAPQFACCVDRSHEVAVGRYTSSQLYRHLESLSASTLKGQAIEEMVEWDLVGTPDEIGERLQGYQHVGVAECPAIIFVADTPGEFEDQMVLFAEEVMPQLGGVQESNQHRGS